jgi:hypothetical protein
MLIRRKKRFKFKINHCMQELPVGGSQQQQVEVETVDLLKVGGGGISDSSFPSSAGGGVGLVAAVVSTLRLYGHVSDEEGAYRCVGRVEAPPTQEAAAENNNRLNLTASRTIYFGGKKKLIKICIKIFKIKFIKKIFQL